MSPASFATARLMEYWALEAPDQVGGPALDFCVLVIQRRHRSGTALVATGPAADHWLDVAQGFAGPPGPGRAAAG